MKKLFLSAFVLLVASGVFAQGKLMVGAGLGILAPTCTNCKITSGGSISGSYAVISKLAVGVNLGLYTRSEGVSSYTVKSNVVMAGATADFYLKEAFKGFYVGADLSIINLSEKYSGVKTSTSDFTAGANIGWAFAIGDKFRIIPHLGFGTWNSNAKGRFTSGLKVGFKI